MMTTASSFASRVFYSYSEASDQGFHSRSQWAKQGRSISPDAIASFVVHQLGKSLGRPCYPVVEEIEPDIFLFVEKGFLVFSVDQTIITVITVIKVSSSSTSSDHYLCKHNTTPPPYTPITMCGDIIDTIEIPHISRKYEEKQEVNNFPKNEKLLTSLITKNIYNPTNLKPEQLPKEYEEAIRTILHILHYRHCIEAIPKDDFVPLKAAYLRCQIPNWNRIKQWLLTAKIIETDHFYIQGKKSYGYRAGERYRQSPYRLITIKTTSPKEQDDDNPKPLQVHTWLKKQAQRIEVADDETSDQLKIIKDGLWKFNSKDAFGWRFHSNLTRLKTEGRKTLRINGKPLVEIDIKNSQPLFLAKLLKERGVEGCDKFIDICQQDLYAYLAVIAGVTRSEAKTAVIETVFFARIGAKHRIKTLFKAEFPKVWQFIEGIKKKDHKKLARLLQRTEAQFIIYTVCERIRNEAPETFIATIHDSILHLPKDSEYVRAVLDSEFAKYGLKPKLEVTYAGD